MTVSISLSESATTATSTVQTQTFLSESAAARDAITSAGLFVRLTDKATTRDSIQSDSGNISNGRYVR